MKILLSIAILSVVAGILALVPIWDQERKIEEHSFSILKSEKNSLRNEFLDKSTQLLQKIEEGIPLTHAPLNNEPDNERSLEEAIMATGQYLGQIHELTKEVSKLSLELEEKEKQLSMALEALKNNSSDEANWIAIVAAFIAFFAMIPPWIALFMKSENADK